MKPSTLAQRVNLGIGKIMTPELRTPRQNQKLGIAAGGFALYLVAGTVAQAKAGIGMFGEGSYIPAVGNVYIDTDTSYIPMVEAPDGSTKALNEYANGISALAIANIITRKVNQRARRKALHSLT